MFNGIERSIGYTLRNRAANYEYGRPQHKPIVVESRFGCVVDDGISCRFISLKTAEWIKSEWSNQEKLQ